MPRHTKPALKIPAFLIAVLFLSRPNITLAQCEIHEDPKLTASDAEPLDLFGSSVSISGDVAFVGANRDDCTAGVNCGSVYVYRFNGDNWVEEQKLTASDAEDGAYFGYSVSVSGDVAVVGAPDDDCAGGTECGAAYVYRFNGSAWVEEQKLTASDVADHDQFGFSVSVSGDVTLVGAYGDDCGGGQDCGAAYVYRFNDSAWVQEAKLVPSVRARFDQFGWRVSVSGDASVIGSPFYDCAGEDVCGSAYVFRFNGSTWFQQAKLAASDAAPGDQFGYSVAVSGNTIVVGALYDDCMAGIWCGSAYVFRFNGSTWFQQAKLTASDAAQHDNFGLSVSVSGDTVIVAAPLDDCVGGVNCGSAYIYRLIPGAPGRWVEQGKLTASNAAESSGFGSSVSVCGDSAVVGAPFSDCAVGGCYGSAYVYALGSFPLPADCNTNGIADDCDIAACTGDPACADCNANSVPDGCEPDCNSNAIADECDIREGVSRDADANGVPDECEAGACCDGSTGLCADAVSMALCAEAPRTWSVNTLCAELDPRCAGACCDLLTGACTENLPPIVCSGVQQRWTGGATCTEAGCAAVTGACCDHDPFGGCTDGFTRAECNCTRCEWSKLALCDDVECPQDSIPTVGVWGLAILTLLLMTGAKIRFGRLRRS